MLVNLQALQQETKSIFCAVAMQKTLGSTKV